MDKLPLVPWHGLPSQLPPHRHLPKGFPVAWDTETNTLFVDDGARVSTASVGWIEMENPSSVEGGRLVIRYVAWPFAQGRVGKAEDDGVRDLFYTGDMNLPPREWVALMNWLARAPWGLIGHNAKFDLHVTREGVLARPKLEGKGSIWQAQKRGYAGVDLVKQVVWDTMLAAKELYPRESAALKPTSVRLGLDPDGGDEDAEQKALKPYLGPKTNPRYDLVPIEVMNPYAAKDTGLTMALWWHQQCELAEGHNAHGRGGWTARHWIEREVEVMKALYRMEQAGVPFDGWGAEHARIEVDRRIEAEQAKLPFLVEQAKQFFFETNQDGVPVWVGTPGGGSIQGKGYPPYSVTTVKREPQMTAEVVAQMVQDEIPYAQGLQNINKLKTANKMWYVPYRAGLGADSRLRTSFRQASNARGDDGGTRSGRFSVERVNLQAIPHDYRLSEFEIMEGIATPRQLIGQAAARLPGWELWETDLAQAELRVAAMWAGCQKMLDAIERGEDLHGNTTTELFHIESDDRTWGQMRQVAKRGNFSLIFGSGWLTFQRMVKKETGVALTDWEAKRIVADWNTLYPEFRRAIEQHSRQVEKVQHVTLANGRARWFTSYEDRHKAFNQRVQASLAEYGKEWILSTERLLEPMHLAQRGLDEGVGRGGLLLVIHDSQVLLLPEAGRADQADQVAPEAIMEQIRLNGVQLWHEMFPGVSGDAEAKRWK